MGDIIFAQVIVSIKHFLSGHLWGFFVFHYHNIVSSRHRSTFVERDHYCVFGFKGFPASFELTLISLLISRLSFEIFEQSQRTNLICITTNQQHMAWSSISNVKIGYIWANNDWAHNPLKMLVQLSLLLVSLNILRRIRSNKYMRKFFGGN